MSVTSPTHTLASRFIRERSAILNQPVGHREMRSDANNVTAGIQHLTESDISLWTQDEMCGARRAPQNVTGGAATKSAIIELSSF